MIARALKLTKDWVFTPELEVILHPSRRRLQWLGVFTLVGHLIFWWVWTAWLPQPFEEGWLRLLMALTGIGLIFQPAGHQGHSQGMKLYFSIVCWLQLPFFFIWMYCMNGSSAMWMATVAVMIVVYFQLTDWRLASAGLFLGAVCASLLTALVVPDMPPPPAEHIVVAIFALVSALLLALSSANLRRERLRHSLNVIGIMAHELRTPLATMALTAHALRDEAAKTDPQHTDRLHNLATRMDGLSRAINHHIDLQMTNARYAYAPVVTQCISALQLLKQTLADYPFGSKRERQCVQLVAHEDFWFHGSERQFIQVLNNLIKNALHSLKIVQSRYEKGDLHIELGKRDATGRIQITDRGAGIDANKIRMIFEPFYSSANETGHGLGLAFCKQVIEAAHGTIRVQAEPAMGATFTIELPCQSAPSKDTTHAHEVSPVSPT